MDKSRKYYFVTGLMCMLTLIVLGVIFYKERVAFGDTAYQAVYLLIEQKPYINWVRAGSIIPQFIPLTAIWLHAGLKTVLILHSLSFLIFFLAMYLLAYRYSEKKLIFFVIPLYLVLITNEVFYWPQSELQQGMIWLCLYATILFEKKWDGLNQWVGWFIHFIFILWVQFFHPLLFIPILFLIVYYYSSESKFFSVKSLVHLIICAVSFKIRYKIGLLNEYESHKLDIVSAINDHLPHFFALASVHVFLHKLTSVYLIYFIFLLGGVIWLVSNQKYLKALALVGFSFGYWVLIMISSPDDARFYTENMLLPLSFMAALPMVADILPRYTWRYLPALLCLIIFVRLGFIYHAHQDYTVRFAIYDPYFEYIKKNKLNGVFVDDKLIDQKKAIMTWGSGYETILISSLASPDSCRIVQIDNDLIRYSWAVNADKKSPIDADTIIVTPFGVWGQSQVPRRYFKLQGGKYEIVTRQP